MFEWVLRSIGVSKAKGPRPSYEEAKVIASKGSVAERTQLATHADLEPELLYYLAEDKAVEVRKEIAANDGTPLQADKILAKDAFAEVRSELAYKISRLIPTLTEQENERLTDMTFEVLEILANDELPEVRAIISVEIKTLDTVPKPVVTKLAHDVEEIVSAPILEYSPLLTEQELVQIIAGGIQGAALMAVARRKELGEDASAAVAGTLDKTAVTELLKNETARISQKTTDVIGMNAENTPEWHRPLIERSNLSLHTIKRIATFVSAAMVDRLIEVHGLSAEIARDLRQHVRERIEGDDEDYEREGKPEPMDRAKEMLEKGELTEEHLQKAIEKGDITLIPLPSPCPPKWTRKSSSAFSVPTAARRYWPLSGRPSSAWRRLKWFSAGSPTFPRKACSPTPVTVPFRSRKATWSGTSLTSRNEPAPSRPSMV